MALKRFIAACCLAAIAVPGMALEVRFERVAENVYAHVGDTGARSADNQGLNANLGLVVTPAGALLIDSGATFRSARLIHEAIGKLTAQPVRWVINTGGQDHRWLGNGYFQSQGAEIIAHAHAVPDMRSRGGDQLDALHLLLGAQAEGTVPTLPTRLIDGADARIDLGGTVIELRHRGGGHTPGDTADTIKVVVWLPQTNVLFAGDIVYVDRLLAVIPVSSTRRWLDTFAVIEALAPQRIVPGHGRITDLATAGAQTRNCLQALRAHMKRAVDQGTDLSEAIRTFDGRPWLRQLNAAELMPGNASRVYLEVERE